MASKKKLKKGEVVSIKTKRGLIFYGLIFDLSQKQITLAHNFDGVKPIDKTDIIVDDIVDSKTIEPKEINTLSDVDI